MKPHLPMLISSYSLAMALYPGRIVRRNKRLPFHRRMMKRLRRWFA